MTEFVRDIQQAGVASNLAVAPTREYNFGAPISAVLSFVGGGKSTGAGSSDAGIFERALADSKAYAKANSVSEESEAFKEYTYETYRKYSLEAGKDIHTEKMSELGLLPTRILTSKAQQKTIESTLEANEKQIQTLAPMFNTGNASEDIRRARTAVQAYNYASTASDLINAAPPESRRDLVKNIASTVDNNILVPMWSKQLAEDPEGFIKYVTSADHTALIDVIQGLTSNPEVRASLISETLKRRDVINDAIVANKNKNLENQIKLAENTMNAGLWKKGINPRVIANSSIAEIVASKDKLQELGNLLNGTVGVSYSTETYQDAFKVLQAHGTTQEGYNNLSGNIRDTKPFKLEDSSGEADKINVGKNRETLLKQANTQMTLSKMLSSDTTEEERFKYSQGLLEDFEIALRASVLTYAKEFEDSELAVDKTGKIVLLKEGTTKPAKEIQAAYNRLYSLVKPSVDAGLIPNKGLEDAALAALGVRYKDTEITNELDEKSTREIAKEEALQVLADVKAKAKSLEDMQRAQKYEKYFENYKRLPPELWSYSKTGKVETVKTGEEAL